MAKAKKKAKGKAPTSFDNEAALLLLKKAHARVEWLMRDTAAHLRPARASLARAVEHLQEFVRQTDPGYDNEILAHYKRFEEMRKRFGTWPTPEEFGRAKADERVALMLRAQAHQVIARIMGDLAKLGTFYRGDAEWLDGLWREFFMLPYALRGAKMKSGGREKGALSPHTEYIKILRDSGERKDYHSVWLRMKKDKMWKAAGEDVLVFILTGKPVKAASLPGILTRLSKRDKN
jgi:hypothetical protein